MENFDFYQNNDTANNSNRGIRREQQIIENQSERNSSEHNTNKVDNSQIQQYTLSNMPKVRQDEMNIQPNSHDIHLLSDQESQTWVRKERIQKSKAEENVKQIHDVTNIQDKIQIEQNEIQQVQQNNVENLTNKSIHFSKRNYEGDQYFEGAEEINGEDTQNSRDTQNFQPYNPPLEICEMFQNKYTSVRMGYSQQQKTFTINKYFCKNKRNLMFLRQEWENETKIIDELASQNITLPLIHKDDNSNTDYPFMIEQVAGQKDLKTLKENCVDLFMNSTINDKNKVYDSFISIIFLRLLQKLQKMHSIGYAHSDIKPLNMVIGYDFDVYFIDFGGSVQKPKENEQNEYLYSLTTFFNLQKYYFLNKDNKIEGIQLQNWEDIQICDLSQLALSILFLILQDSEQDEETLFKQKQFSQLLKKYQDIYPKVVYLISLILNKADDTIKILGSFDELDFKVGLHDISQIAQYVYDVSYDNKNDQFVAKRINSNSIFVINLIDKVFQNVLIDPSQMDIFPPPQSNIDQKDDYNKYKEFKQLVSRHQIIEKYFEDRSSSSDDYHYLHNLCRQFQIGKNKSFTVQVYNLTQIHLLLKGLLTAWQESEPRYLTIAIYINSDELLSQFIKKVKDISDKYTIKALKLYDEENKFHKITLAQYFNNKKDEQMKLTFGFCIYVQPKVFQNKFELAVQNLQCKELKVNLQVRSETIPPNYNTFPDECLKMVGATLKKYPKNILKYAIDVSVKTISKAASQIFQIFREINLLTLDNPHDRQHIYGRFQDAFLYNQDTVLSELQNQYKLDQSQSKNIFNKFKRYIENEGIQQFQMQRQIQGLMTLIYMNKASRVIIKYNNYIFQEKNIWNVFSSYLREKPEVSYEFIIQDCLFSEDAFNEVIKLKEMKNNIEIEYQSLNSAPEETYYKVICEFLTIHSPKQRQQPTMKIIFRTSQVDATQSLQQSQPKMDVVESQQNQKPNVQIKKEDIIKLLNKTDFSKLLQGVQSFKEFSILQKDPKKIKIQFNNQEIDHFTVFKNESYTVQKVLKKKQLSYFKKELSHDYYQNLVDNNSKFINVTFSNFKQNQQSNSNENNEQNDPKIVAVDFYQMYSSEEVVIQKPPKRKQNQYHFAQLFQQQYRNQQQEEEVEEEEIESHMNVSFKKYTNLTMKKKTYVHKYLKFFMKKYFDEKKIIQRVAFKLPNEKQKNDEEIFTDIITIKSSNNTISESVFSQIIGDVIVRLNSNTKQFYFRNCGIKDEHLNLIPVTFQQQQNQRVFLDLTENDRISLVGLQNLLKLLEKEVFATIELISLNTFSKQCIEQKLNHQYNYLFEADKLIIRTKDVITNNNCIHIKLSINSEKITKDFSRLDNVYVEDVEEVKNYEKNNLLIAKCNQNQDELIFENWIILDDLKYRNYIDGFIGENVKDEPEQMKSSHTDDNIVRVLSEIIEKYKEKHNNFIDTQQAYERRNQQVQQRVLQPGEMDFEAMNQAALASVMMQLQSGRRW